MKHHKNLITSRMVKSKPPAAVPCFQFIADCKHDLKSHSCPLCKLVNTVTKSHFEDEREQSQRARDASIVNRAILRLTLLRRWSRCQSSIYSKHLQCSSVDIVLSRTTAALLVQNEDVRSVDFSELGKLLARRNRMREVGLDAVVFLQSRIRTFLAKCKVRKMLLRRIEYVEAGRTKPGYWYDKKKLRKLHRPPALLCRLQDSVLTQPVTPRTVERRLAAEQRRADKRLALYINSTSAAKASSSSSGDGDGDALMARNIMEREDLRLQLLIELSVLRDLILVAMTSIARGIRADQESKGGVEAADASALVWVSMSAPAPSCRSIGLSLALQTTPSPVLNNNHSSSAHPTNKPSSAADDKLLQRYLRALEDRVWQSLSCSCPEDVLRIVLSADWTPTLGSVMNITQDDKGIWNGQLAHLPASASSITVDLESSRNSLDGAAAADELVPRSSTAAGASHQLEVLPLSLQLHSRDPQMHPSGLFRLFFYREDLVAVSSCSPWVFYPEVYAHKDDINASIREYSSQGTTKAFIKQLLQRANIHCVSSSSQLKSTALGKLRSKGLAPFEHQLQSLFLPPSELVFDPAVPAGELGNMCPGLDLNKLTDERILYLAEHYRFLRKKPGFTNRYSRANNNRKRRKQKADAAGLNTDQSSTAAVKSSSDGFQSWCKDASSEPYLDPVVLRDESVSCSTIITKDADRSLLMDLRSIQQSKGFTGTSIRSVLRGADPSEASPDEETQERSPDGLLEYPAKLHRYSSRIATDIEDRINTPDDIEWANESFPLVVMDVHVNLPEKSSSSLTNRQSRSDQKHLGVALHHVVGAFSCETDRPPPNLDCSLIDWHYIVGIHSSEMMLRGTLDAIDAQSHYKVGRKTIKKSSVGSSQSTSSHQAPATGHWNSIDSVTGVSTYRVAAGIGKEFQLCVLGAPPSRRYLEETLLPPKVKEWLGMQTTVTSTH